MYFALAEYELKIILRFNDKILMKRTNRLWASIMGITFFEVIQTNNPIPFLFPSISKYIGPCPSMEGSIRKGNEIC